MLDEGIANRSFAALQNHGLVGPIVWELRQWFGFMFIDCALTADREVDPPPTARAAADKTRIGPPRPHKWIVYGPPESFQAEINRLQTLFAPSVGTPALTVDYLRCR